MLRRRHLILLAASGGLAATASAGWLVWRQRAARADAAIDDVCIVAPTFAFDPASGLAPTAAREVPATARCPVCGMFPARHRRWAAQVIFLDGAVQYLDSPLSLFHYLQRVDRYTPGRAAADIAAMYVSDQATGQWLDAERAIAELVGHRDDGRVELSAAGQERQRAIAGSADHYMKDKLGQVAEADLAAFKRVLQALGHD